MNTIPEYRLYSLNQITVAAFLGAPFPGFWLASRNFAALGKKRESRRSLIWGIALTLGGVVVAFLVPEKFPALAVSLPFVIATRSIAKQWFGQELSAHISAGGQFGSWWVSILVGVSGLVLVLAILFGVMLLGGE